MDFLPLLCNNDQRENYYEKTKLPLKNYSYENTENIIWKSNHV